MANQDSTEDPSNVSSNFQELEMLREVPRWQDLISRKWRHQTVAITFLERYLDMGEKNREHAAMIRMPTGSGKTGIMAILSNYYSASGILNVVIIVPSDFLTDQICQALNRRFWLRLKKKKGKPVGGPKPAVRFFPSTLEDRLTEFKNQSAIYVCTTQTLYMLHKNLNRKESDPDRKESWVDSYCDLRRIATLVLVDEGHREPAKEWAKAVRSFSLPTVLFTATPYRNDLRFFHVGPEEDFRHTFTFHQAVQRRIIRNVQFEDQESFANNPTKFVEVLLRYFYGEFQSNIPADVTAPKVIVRCEDFVTIEEIKKLLSSALKQQNRTETVLAVHDRFPKNDPEELIFHDVPQTHDATFWVHQYKLTEGLDNSDFCLLAFFEPFSNARALVQQIGRLLRNRDLKENQYATVLSDPSYALREQWNGYLAFEDSERSLVGPEDIVERFLQSLPEWFYAGGRYRQASNLKSTTLEDETVWNDLRLRKSASIYQLPVHFGKRHFNELVTSLTDALEDQDMIEVKTLPAKKDDELLAAVLSWRIIQTEALSEGGFFNVDFVPSVLYAHDGFLFHSGPIGLSQLDENESLIRLAPGNMEKLLGKNPIIKQVSLISCDLSNTAVRRRSMGARSIAEIAPGLNDHFHFVSTAVGTFQNGGPQRRRYLGLSTGRITEAKDSQIDIKEFKEWAHELAEQLKIQRFRSPAVFNRFARSVKPPSHAQAAHLLLDLVEFFDGYGQRPAIFPDTFEATVCDVSPNGTFECVVGDTPITGTVTYSNPKKGTKRFVLKSEKLDKEFKLTNPEVGNKNQSASGYFNDRGLMRIITTDRQLYADKHFYEPRVPISGPEGLDNLELLFGVEALAQVETEKGHKGKFGKDTWESGSIFHLIDQTTHLYRRRFGDLKPEILVCEDLGPEYCDFIAVNRERRRIALIHAKQCEGGLSAADLHIINSQVTKNLEFLNPTGSVGPDRGRKWKSPWGPLKRVRRVPKGMSSDGVDVFHEIQDLIRKPSTEREVWMVLGNGFSIKKLKAALKAPPYHVVHLIYLLQSCNANVSSVGAKLRIFTSK